jgi:hypothetical protein
VSDIRTALILDLAGNLQRKAQQYGQSMEQMGQRGSKGVAALKTAAAGVGRVLDAVGNRYTALLTGAAGVGTAKGLLDLQDRLTNLGIQANVGDTAIQGLMARVYEISRAKDVRLRPDKLLDGIDAIVEKTGDLRFAEQNLRNLGLGMRATGADGRAMGELFAEFQKMGIKAPKDVLQALDILNVQGKEGAFTLQNLAALGPRVITAYTSMGRTGVPALREMGAALQMIRMGTGSSEMAATSFEALIRTLGDAKKVKMLQAGGIQVFDPEEAKKGNEVLRPVNELLAEIIKKTSGKRTLLSKVFDEEAIRAFSQAAGEFKRTGRLESLERFFKVQADGTQTTNDAARAAHNASAAIEMLRASWTKFADGALTGRIQGLADAVNSLSSADVDKWMSRLASGAGVLGGMVLLSKGVGVAANLKNLFGGGGGAAGALAGAGKGMPLPLPVYVVNKHLSLLPGSWTGGTGGTAAGGASAAAAEGAAAGASVTAAVFTAAAPALAAALAGVASHYIAKTIAKSNIGAESTADIREEMNKIKFLGGGEGTERYRLLKAEFDRRQPANPRLWDWSDALPTKTSHASTSVEGRLAASHIPQDRLVAPEGKIELVINGTGYHVKRLEAKGMDLSVRSKLDVDSGRMAVMP